MPCAATSHGHTPITQITATTRRFLADIVHVLPWPSDGFTPWFRPTLFLLKTDTTDETPGNHQDTIDNLEGQCGQPPGGRSTDDAGTIFGVEFRIVTRALERLQLTLPHPRVASRMRTDRRVRHQALHRVRAGCLGEVRSLEAICTH